MLRETRVHRAPLSMEKEIEKEKKNQYYIASMAHV